MRDCVVDPCIMTNVVFIFVYRGIFMEDHTPKRPDRISNIY